VTEAIRNLGGDVGSLKPANLSESVGQSPWYIDPNTGAWVARIDGTYNIGAAASGRPATIYTGALTDFGTLAMGGPILFQVDNSQDIGAAGANRPKGIIVGDDGLTASSTAKVGVGATGITITGARGTGANGTAVSPVLKGAGGTDGPTTGFLGWEYVVLNGFQGAWFPLYY
jgi:hypothetical protein